MDDRRTRWRGRLVTYGLLVALVAAAVGSLEPWPVSSFRLFSERRSGTRTVLVMEAVRADGTRVPLRFTGDVRLTRSVQRQLPDLARQDPAERAGKVRAWVTAAGLEVASVARVEVVSIRRRLDPHGGAPVELHREVMLRVGLQ